MSQKQINFLKRQQLVGKNKIVVLFLLCEPGIGYLFKKVTGQHHEI